MRKYHIKKLTSTVIVLLCLVLSCSAWAARQINDMPFYGHNLPLEVQRYNKEFIARIDSSGVSHTKAAEELIAEGWKYLNARPRQPLFAIRRFNQAWLLDSNNANVFWGLGAAQCALGEYKDGLELLTKAAKLGENNPGILCDIGCGYVHWGVDTKDPSKSQILLGKAITEFQTISKLHPSYEKTYYYWAVALYAEKKYAAAWQMVKKARQLGGKTLDPGFVQELAAKFPEPK
jgi:tetratricopeptide (TPR) repeat protein